jgi:hypothetical protein
MAEPTSHDPRTVNILVELFVAFGQGTGFIHVAPEAIAAAREAYERIVQQHAGKWDEHAVAALTYARGLGRAVAHRALGEGRMVILAEDFTKVADRFRRNDARPYQKCPFCPIMGGE